MPPDRKLIHDWVWQSLLARSNRKFHLHQGKTAEIEDRAIPGHWEGDLLSGSKNSHIVTLVERHSPFTTLLKMPSKDKAVVVAALTRHARKLPAALRSNRRLRKIFGFQTPASKLQQSIASTG